MVGRIIRQIWVIIESVHHLLSSAYMSIHLGVIILLLEKTMAPHSGTVAQKIPWMEEPGRLHSMGSLRVRHD